MAFVERQRPDLVVVSGDLTQRAKPEQFRQARAFVDRIEALGVPTLTVPGNHDVPLYRVWERIFNPFGCYRKYFSPELEPVYRDDELLVVGINTAFGWTLKDGRITLAAAAGGGEDPARHAGERAQGGGRPSPHDPAAQLRHPAGARQRLRGDRPLLQRGRRPDPLGAPPPGLHRQLRGVLPQGAAAGRHPALGDDDLEPRPRRRAGGEHLQLDRGGRQVDGRLPLPLAPQARPLRRAQPPLVPAPGARPLHARGAGERPGRAAAEPVPARPPAAPTATI